ncbi:MAG: hypothetical protein Q8882_05195 [Bacillota bacterium]|nr:hypothetical protein [Bacillota bacterium]
MYYAVGYQRPQNGEYFSDIVMSYQKNIREVYFAWPGMASGRPMLGNNDWAVQSVLEEELAFLVKHGIKLDLLLNANCYGDGAISVGLQDEIVSLMEHLAHIGCYPEIVTTASPFIAHVIKTNCSGVEVRSSVNMRIGTQQAMEYAKEFFDSFYIQRDFGRDLSYVRQIRAWCDAHGKKLCMLANSGCLRFCPSQTFHDNLIAHSSNAELMKNLPDWNPHQCWNMYKDTARFVEILKATWIRPEDIQRYDGLIDVVKLATRQHSHPRMVIGAYTDGVYDGNLLDVLEPGFSSLFFPYYINNALFPKDWAERSGMCRNGCINCLYCENVLEKVLQKYE